MFKSATSPEPVESPTIPPRLPSRHLSEPTEMDLSTLFKFVKPYNGCREKVNSFIINCDNAISLATEHQKPIVFRYILSQLEGKAEVACSIKEFVHWIQLKDFLKEQFCERKHYTHLLADIQESRQGPLENVNQFSLKVETCLSQLMTEISLSTSESNEIPGRIAAMEDLALHHFVMGLHPRISTIVRCRSPQTLNEAINVAISEECIQQAVYRRSQPTENKGKQKNSLPPFSRPNFAQKPTTIFRNENLPSNSQVICRYCKNIGHVLEHCRKREYNNNRFRNTQSRPPNRNLNSFSKPGPSRVNYMQEENIESRDEVDHCTENEALQNPLNY